MEQDLVLSVFVNLLALLGIFLGAIKPYIEDYTKKKVEFEMGKKMEIYKAGLQKKMVLLEDGLEKNMELHKLSLQRNMEEFKDKLSISKKIRERYYEVNEQFMEILINLQESFLDLEGADKPDAIDQASIHLYACFTEFGKFSRLYHRPYLKRWGDKIDILIGALNDLTGKAKSYEGEGGLGAANESYHIAMSTLEFLQDHIYDGINESVLETISS